MKRQIALGLFSLGFIATAVSESEARSCRRVPFDQGYGHYFAAPYVGTGRYAAAYGPGCTAGRGPCWCGSSYYHSPSPAGAFIPPGSIPTGTVPPPCCK